MALALEWVLPHVRPPLVRVAKVAEFVDAGFPGHPGPETAVLVMALRALHQALPEGVPGLPVLLRPDVQVAPVAQIRLARFQVLLDGGVDLVTVRAGDAVDLVPAQVPERQGAWPVPSCFS